MLDPKKENVYSACELSRRMASELGIERSVSCVLNWMRDGCTRGGNVIKLEYISIGRQRCSSLEALERFFKRLEEAE